MNHSGQKRGPAIFEHYFEEAAPHPFDFRATAQEHGWVALRPFGWHPDTAELSRIHRLEGGQVVRVCMLANGPAAQPGVSVRVEAATALGPAEQVEIRRAVRRMLRLDEDLSEMYELMARINGHSLRLTPGAGRLLRCPSLFEDIVYTICTTNITWSGTKRMVERLVTRLGEPFPGQSELQAFPTAGAIAAAGPEFLKQEAGLGYRSGYVWELATAIAEKRLDLSSYEDPALPTEDLYRSLRRIKGIGEYAAATILMLLGRYERLAIDSELKAFVARKYLAGQPGTDAEIRAIYAPWGKWQYLAYWFDTPPAG